MTISITQNKVVSVKVLHLDELGYGPQGQYTRRAWRAECLEKLFAGKDQFENWQQSWQNKINKKLPTVSFDCELQYEDGSLQRVEKSVPYALDFAGEWFDLRLNLSNYNFNLPIIFIGAMFDGLANFGSATFGWVNFSSATFAGGAHFSNATFTGGADFDNTKFVSYAGFHSVSFAVFANFGSATFTEDAHFGSVIFTGDAGFSRVAFTGEAGFRGATFTGDAYFISATFTGRANFKLTTFNQLCLFDNHDNENARQWNKATKFDSKADFENATFKNVGHFERVKFTNHIPSFLGVDTASTRLEFSDDTHFARHDVSEDAVRRLGHLKRLADEHGQIDQALTFNALELHAKAAQLTASLATKFVTGAYEVFSDYGRFFTLPIGWLGFFLCLSFLFGLISPYVNVAPKSTYCADMAKNITISTPRAAFEYALFRASGAIDFTDADKQNNVVNCQIFNQPIEPWWMRVWGIFKAIASLALLFLAALGLRNNYRVR